MLSVVCCFRSAVVWFSQVLMRPNDDCTASDTVRSSIVHSFVICRVCVSEGRAEEISQLAPSFHIDLPWATIENITPEALEAGLRENLDMLKERRAKAHLKNLHFQRAIARLYN
ncbi:hypothetical protein B296_00031875 [Ensete ventricosum]|uniref:Uncharacterized protein n=1 Tax=Ensete ventricosum TaxID=4639 RepID=A0A427A505_ENSVE|nr:hypothetical protein B296_00031875 [Ensete ventricosum]